MRGLLNVVQEYTWELNGGSKMSVYLNAICLLSAMSQVCFPFYLLPFFSINGLQSYIQRAFWLITLNVGFTYKDL